MATIRIKKKELETKSGIYRLIIIGNGFDIAHKLETSYRSFIYWYLDKCFKEIFDESSKSYRHSDDLFTFITTPIDTPDGSYSTTKNGQDEYDDYLKNNYNPIKLLRDFNSRYVSLIQIYMSQLLNVILNNVETKGWTDIESDYYGLIKKNAGNSKECENLNLQMNCLLHNLQEYLEHKESEYLAREQTSDKDNEETKIKSVIHSELRANDIAEESRKKLPKDLIIQGTMFLDFNYTDTTKKYYDYRRDAINHIHGSLGKPEEMVFGYGDEMDKDFKALEDLNNNELLKNSKSIKYLETGHYRDLMQFINGGLFQVFIMGHSCGNSDRTLLNTIFEHENCISIKPFCFFDKDGKDNYSELTQNIYRNFKDKTLFRDRVVNKTQCTTFFGENLI